MTASLARVWLAAATLGAGTALGCGGSPSRIAFVASMVGAGLVARRRSSLVLLGIALLCGGAGGVNASLRCEPVTAVSVLASAVPSCRLSGRVLERAGGLGTLVSADRLTCRDHAPVARAGVVVIDEGLGDLGAAIRAEGWLIPLGEDAFDDARRRLGAQAAFDPVERSVDPPRSALFTAAASIRRGLVDATRPLDPRRAGLLRGLAIGDESGLDGHTEDTFRATGLSHLLAVSGSNVAIVVATVSAGAAALGLRTRLSLCALGLGLFVVVVGPEPSVLRAAVMGGIGLATLAAGRRAEPLHALGLALVILFGLRPGIVFSVGLHLSVAATAGIVLWSQRLAARLDAASTSAEGSADGASAPGSNGPPLEDARRSGGRRRRGGGGSGGRTGAGGSGTGGGTGAGGIDTLGHLLTSREGKALQRKVMRGVFGMLRKRL